MKRLSAFNALLALTLLLGSCAVRTPVAQQASASSSADESTAAPAPVSDAKYKTIVFNRFTASPSIPAPEGPLAECRAAALSQLRGKGLFECVVEAPDDAPCSKPALLVDATLTDLRIVSGAGRFWGGALAGRSHMKLFVKLTDSESGVTVAQKELFGAPNAMGSAWSFGGTDKGLPRNMGILLGDYILESISK